jgi:hypothetical protein
MSSFDLINFLKISDVDRGAKNEEHLSDLRDRAHHIGKKTGYEPMSWYEFKQSTPREEPRTVTNMLLGGAIGLAIGMAIGLIPGMQALLLPLALSGTLLGGALGAFTDTENTRRDALVNKYEDYLNQFEASEGKEHALAQGIDYKTTHAAELLAERQMEPHLSPSK